MLSSIDLGAPYIRGSHASWRPTRRTGWVVRPRRGKASGPQCGDTNAAPTCHEHPGDLVVHGRTVRLDSAFATMTSRPRDKRVGGVQEGFEYRRVKSQSAALVVE